LAARRRLVEALLEQERGDPALVERLDRVGGTAHRASAAADSRGQAVERVALEALFVLLRKPVERRAHVIDVGGRHVVHLSNAAASRRELSTKLRNAGCAVNEEGTAWLSDGDLSL